MHEYPPPYRDRLVDVAVDPGGRGLTVEFAAGSALLGCLAWAAVVAAVDLSSAAGVAGYAVLAVALSWFATPTSALLVGGLSVLFADGFALAREGRLALTAELAVVLVLVSAACAVTAVAGRRWRGRQRRVKTARAGIKDSSGHTSIDALR
jgi:hypothetical protein